MKKVLSFILVGVIALAIPGLALADSASYLQGQVNSTIAAAGQGQVYVGFAAQHQAGAAQSGQVQASVNTANSTALVLGPFGIVLGGTTQVVNANGINQQGQSNAYSMGQVGVGLALGVQSQSIFQGQTQSQVSSGVGN